MTNVIIITSLHKDGILRATANPFPSNDELSHAHNRSTESLHINLLIEQVLKFTKREVPERIFL
jgi:hypothetical protein